MDGKSTASLPVSRKERGTVLEGSHLLPPPLPSVPDESCRTLRGIGSCSSDNAGIRLGCCSMPWWGP